LSSSQVVTGEAVALDLRLAALPSRLVAGAIDVLLQLVVLLVFGAVAGAVSLDVSEAVVNALSILLIVVVLIVYPVTFETLLRGRTPGKAAMGLRVVRDDGGPIGFRHALVRGLTGAFLERPGLTFFVAAVVTSLLSSRDKRVGDLLAGTVVLQERVSTRGGQVAQMPPQLAGWAAALDLSGLTDDLALSARQFVSRASDLTPTAREDLGVRLVAAVLAVTRPAPPPGTPGWAVLAAVLAERRRRDQARYDGGTGSRAGRPAGSTPGSATAPLRPVSTAATQPDVRPPTGSGGFAPPS
jgi:uncharacterized RDD family membrane protein YckC